MMLTEITNEMKTNGDRVFTNDNIFKDDKPKEDIRNVQTVWSNFKSEATVHGLVKLTGSKIRIVIWSVIILASFAYLVYILVQELKKYYSYPIMTQVTVEFYNEMDFPAVTICNLCWRNKSKINNSTQSDIYYGSVTPIGHSLPKVNWSDPWYRNNGFFEPLNESFMNDQAMELSKFLQMCWFDTGYNVTCEEVFTPVITASGLCYTFNIDGAWKTSFSGSDFNLQVYVDVHTDEYTWSEDIGSGIQVLVHEPGTFPDIKYHGVWTKPGSAVYAEITKKEYQYQKQPYKAFGDKYCETEFPEWSSSKHRYSYTRQYCLHLCFARIISEICGCKLLDSQEDLVTCSLYQYQKCYLPTLEEVRGNTTLAQRCDCKKPCQFTQYAVSLTTATFPSDFMADKFENLPSIRGNRMKIDGIYLRVYLKELLIDKLTQTPVYENLGDVFAKLGGQMGLFLGASVMSVLELGEFFMMLFHLLAIRRQNRTSTK